MGITRSWYYSELPNVYLIRHPSNVFRWNRAAGSEAYGVYYMLDDSTKGLDAVSEICPSGNAIGELSNNIVHSNRKTGLRITTLVSRTNPCAPIKSDLLADKYSQNPSIANTISNITIYKSGDKGLLVQDVGATTFVNITVADNSNCGIMFLNTDYSNSNVTLQNAIIVGSSSNNGDNSTSPTGLSVPFSVSFKASGVTYYRFFSGTATAVSSNTLSPDFIMSFFEKIRYSNVNCQFVNWNGIRDIFVDLDGTLTRPFFSNTPPPNFSSAYLIPRLEANLIQDKCYPDSTNRWPNSLLCNSQTKPRTVVLYGLSPFYWNGLVLTRVNQYNSVPLSNSNYLYGEWSQSYTNSWALSFIPNNTYEIRMEYTNNFLRLFIASSRFMLESDPAVILRFVYTESRELYEIKRIIAGVAGSLLVAQTDFLNATSCTAGDYYHNHSATYVDICVTAR